MQTVIDAFEAEKQSIEHRISGKSDTMTISNHTECNEMFYEPAAGMGLNKLVYEDPGKLLRECRPLAGLSNNVLPIRAALSIL